MSYDDKDSKPKVWEGAKSKWVWSIFLFGAFGLLLHYFPPKIDFSSWFTSSPSRQVANASLPSAAPRQQIIRIEVDPEQWSEWITIPPGNAWRISRPGCWEQYWFWSEAGPRPRLEPGDREWFGSIPTANFKLRGTKGPVEIIIEPR